MRTSTIRLLALAALLAASSTLATGPSLTGPSAETRSGESHADCPLARAGGSRSVLPEQVGQDAFSALAEMRAILDEDPGRDWARVDLDALRDHLVDMDRVVLFANVEKRPVSGGFEADVTGEGRTLEAIQRMVQAHSRHMGASSDLNVEVSVLDDGLRVKVVTAELSEVPKLRALGFFGFLASGDHHRPHHLAMALGGGHP